MFNLYNRERIVVFGTLIIIITSCFNAFPIDKTNAYAGESAENTTESKNIEEDGDVEVHSDNKADSSKISWTANITPTICYSDGTTRNDLTISNYSVVISENSTSGKVWDEYKGASPMNGTFEYDGSVKSFNFTVNKCELSDGRSITIKSDNMSTEVYEEIDGEKNLNFSISSLKIITADSAPVTYTFVQTVSPDALPFKNGASLKEIKTKLKSDYPRVGIDVKSSSGETETWADAVKVKWDSAPKEDYDPDDTSWRTLTWTGTVKAQTVTNDEDESKEVEIKADQTVEVAIVVAGEVDEYENYEAGKLTGDYDDDDLGAVKATLSESVVKKIIEELYKQDDFSDYINAAIIADEKLSIWVDVEALDKDDLDDKIIDKFEDKGDIASLYDLKAYLVVGGKKISKPAITDTGKDISFTHTIPSDKKLSSSSSSAYNRIYRVYGYHDDDDDEVQSRGDWTSANASTVSFKSSKFSYFATVYKDESKTSSSSSNPNAAANSTSIRSASTLAPGTGADASGDDGATGSKAPKTGDDFNARMWIFFIVVGVVVALCSFILYQDTKEWQEEKKTES